MARLNLVAANKIPQKEIKPRAAKAPRPAYSVLRSERGGPSLPHWRDGLRDCLSRMA